jgi:hypothetical protein
VAFGFELTPNLSLSGWLPGREWAGTGRVGKRRGSHSRDGSAPFTAECICHTDVSYPLQSARHFGFTILIHWPGMGFGSCVLIPA